MDNPLEHIINIAKLNEIVLQSNYYNKEQTQASKEISKQMISAVPSLSPRRV